MIGRRLLYYACQTGKMCREFRLPLAFNRSQVFHLPLEGDFGVQALFPMPRSQSDSCDERLDDYRKWGRGSSHREAPGQLPPTSPGRSSAAPRARHTQRTAAVVAAERIVMRESNGGGGGAGAGGGTTRDVTGSGGVTGLDGGAMPKLIGPHEWSTMKAKVMEMMALDKSRVYSQPPIASVGKGKDYQMYLAMVGEPFWLSQIQKKIGKVKMACRCVRLASRRWKRYIDSLWLKCCFHCNGARLTYTTYIIFSFSFEVGEPNLVCKRRGAWTTAGVLLQAHVTLC